MGFAWCAAVAKVSGYAGAQCHRYRYHRACDRTSNCANPHSSLKMQPAVLTILHVFGVCAGGSPARVEAARAIVEAGVAVMGHVGLTPQSVSVLGEPELLIVAHGLLSAPGQFITNHVCTLVQPRLAPCSSSIREKSSDMRNVKRLAVLARMLLAAGGFRPQAQVASEAVRVIDQAKALQDSGCFAIVLECIPAPIAAAVTQALSIPTIGIGAGPQCSGQVRTGN